MNKKQILIVKECIDDCHDIFHSYVFAIDDNTEARVIKLIKKIYTDRGNSDLFISGVDDIVFDNLTFNHRGFVGTVEDLI